jgi:uncharacterized protein (DUF362 family)
MSEIHISGVGRGSTDQETIGCIEKTAADAFGGFSWLKPGELVWLKVALNSCDPYPATTDWRAIKAVANQIVSRGGRVIVADQSGIEYDDKGNERESPSEHCYAASGMAKSGLDFRALEDFGHERYTDPRATHWPQGFRVTRLVADADHIINLPRISGHGQAGESLGAKSWVGALQREDRYAFHAQGPLYWFIRWVKLGSGENLPRPNGQNAFFEMIAELALAFRPKLRGTLFVATKLQTTLGPNRHLMTIFGRIGLFKAYVLEPATGVVIGSDDPVAADAAALAFLFGCYEQTPWFHRLLQRILILANGRIRRPGYSIWTNPVISRQLELGLGKRPTRILAHGLPSELLADISRALGLDPQAG